MRNILLVATEPGVGLTSACLGVIKTFDYLGVKTAYSKPFLQNDLNKGKEDRSSALVKRTFNLESPKPIAQKKIEKLLGDGQLDELLEKIVSEHQRFAEDEFVIIEGLVPTAYASYADEINAALARALDASVILVSSGDIQQAQDVADHVEMHARVYGGMQHVRMIGCILMRVRNFVSSEPTGIMSAGESFSNLDAEQLATLVDKMPKEFGSSFQLFGLVPYSETFSLPRTIDIANAIGAKWINEGENLTRRVKNIVLVSRTVANAAEHIKPGVLIVTPGDRDDIAVAVCLCAMNGTPIAGLLLTGGLALSKTTLDLCDLAFKSGLPVMSATTDSYKTAYALSQMSAEIPHDDIERAENVAAFVAAHLDINALKNKLSSEFVSRLSPSAFRHLLVEKAKQKLKLIVLPEGAEPRTVEAAIICENRGIAKCILLAKREEVEAVAKSRDLSLPENLQIVDPAPLRKKYVAPMVKRRKGKLTEPMAEAQLQDNVVLGTMMLYLGEVDGLVSGAIHTTANTVRPAFQLIKTASDYSLVSSVFFMLLPEQVVVYGDCAINPDPNAQQLAEIAIQSAKSAQAFGIEPKVAMISYSTGESGSGSDVDKVREATAIAKKLAPDLIIDGPLQYDAAAIESVGLKKAPNSKVAGKATVFVFPDLNTGNTTYKAVQRSAKVLSVGPMLQGLNKPVNDLSRGALVDDIVFTIGLTSIQAADDSL